VSSAAVERSPTFCLFHAPIASQTGLLVQLGYADMTNGYRPTNRGLLITKMVMSGMVTTTDTDDLDWNIYIDDLSTVLCSLTFDRGTSGWQTVVADVYAYVRPNDDASPQWIGSQLVPASGGGVVTNISLSLYGEYLWA
jgi:hypothetical protein